MESTPSIKKDDTKVTDEYTYIESIGSGSFGEVFLAKNN